MKQFLKPVLLFGCLFLVLTRGEAQTAKRGNNFIRLSAGVDGGLPVGAFSDHYNWSIGGSLQADLGFIPEVLYITANAGFQNFFYDNGIGKGEDLRLLPVKAGIKYFPIKLLYVQAEAGVSFLVNKSDVRSDKSAVFVYAPQAGVYIPLGGSNAIDAGFRYERMSVLTSGQDSPGYFGLRLAYSFGL